MNKHKHLGDVVYVMYGGRIIKFSIVGIKLETLTPASYLYILEDSKRGKIVTTRLADKTFDSPEELTAQLLTTVYE